ncbi:MAG: hypothetical protein O2854_08800, partial [Chloroflexi bacterium]|nr:hypothetical protein [Chloroflexota bacterium]
MTSRLSSLPSVDKVLADPRIAHLLESFSRESVVELVREGIAAARQHTLQNGNSPTLDAIVEDI